MVLLLSFPDNRLWASGQGRYGRTDGRTDGWMDGRTDGRTNSQTEFMAGLEVWSE